MTDRVVTTPGGRELLVRCLPHITSMRNEAAAELVGLIVDYLNESHVSESKDMGWQPDKLTDAERLHWLAIVNLGIDNIGGIDLHERAMSHCVERLRGEIDEKTEANEQDYLAAIRDGISEAIYGTD